MLYKWIIFSLMNLFCFPLYYVLKMRLSVKLPVCSIVDVLFFLWIYERAVLLDLQDVLIIYNFHSVLNHHNTRVLFSRYSLWHGRCSHVWAGESGPQRVGRRDYPIGGWHGYYPSVWRNLYPFWFKFFHLLPVTF